MDRRFDDIRKKLEKMRYGGDYRAESKLKKLELENRRLKELLQGRFSVDILDELEALDTALSRMRVVLAKLRGEEDF